jgi:hypothetical protein
MTKKCLAAVFPPPRKKPLFRLRSLLITEYTAIHASFITRLSTFTELETIELQGRRDLERLSALLSRLKGIKRVRCTVHDDVEDWRIFSSLRPPFLTDICLMIWRLNWVDLIDMAADLASFPSISRIEIEGRYSSLVQFDGPESKLVVSSIPCDVGRRGIYFTSSSIGSWTGFQIKSRGSRLSDDTMLSRI